MGGACPPPTHREAHNFILYYCMEYIISCPFLIKSLAHLSCAKACAWSVPASLTMCSCADCKKWGNVCTCTHGRCGNPECRSLQTKDGRCDCPKHRGHKGAWRNIDAGCHECKDCWAHSDPPAWPQEGHSGPKKELIPLDLEAWEAQQAMAQAAPQAAPQTMVEMAVAGKGAGKADVQAAMQAADLSARLETQEARIFDLEQDLHDLKTEHETAVRQHAEQIQALEQQVEGQRWYIHDIWNRMEKFKIPYQ